MKDSKKTEEVKTITTAAASKAAPKADSKAAAKTTAAKKPAAKKAAPAKKTAAKTTSKKAAPKTAAKKTKSVAIDSICEKLEKMINKTKASAIKKTIAVDIEVYEFEDGSNQKMYVEIKGGKAAVAPHSYDDKSFKVALSFANAVAFVNGKITLAQLLDSDKFYAEGNIADAIKFASIF